MCKEDQNMHQLDKWKVGILGAHKRNKKVEDDLITKVKNQMKNWD